MINAGLNRRGLGQSVDWALIGAYLALVFIGWINIYASVHSGGPSSIFDWEFRCGKQFVWMLTAFSLAGIILFVIPPRFWEPVSLPLYIAVLVLLVLVIFVSKDVNGSHSWFEFGPVKFQPAEISKITTSLVLAMYLSQSYVKLSRLDDLAKAFLIIGLPMLIIIGESETGSALVYIGFLFVLYSEGLSGWWLGIIGIVIALFIATLKVGAYPTVIVLLAALILWVAIGGASFTGPFERRKKFWLQIGIGAVYVTVLALMPSWISKPVPVLLAMTILPLPLLAWFSFQKKNKRLALAIGIFLIGLTLVFSTDYIFQNVLQPYQRSRIEVLLGLKEDPSGVGYNVNQSKIAIGSGGVFGKGFLHGTQTSFGFVPEQSTDFIFCTVGEEWGLLGCLIVIALYVFILVRLMQDAQKCRAAFNRIYGYCVAACIFMHLFINIGMTVGLMPVIGIPLPLLSYGGSSLWAFTILIFIFIALYRDEKKYF